MNDHRAQNILWTHLVTILLFENWKKNPILEFYSMKKHGTPHESAYQKLVYHLNGHTLGVHTEKPHPGQHKKKKTVPYESLLYDSQPLSSGHTF